MRVTRTIVAASAALAALAMAAPASATSAGASASCGYSQACSGVAQDVPGIGSAGTDVQVECNAQTPLFLGLTATTVSTVQATIVQCYILGNNGDEHWTDPRYTQGQSSSLEHKFESWDLSSRSYILCVGAGYVSDRGVFHEPANFVCNPGV